MSAELSTPLSSALPARARHASLYYGWFVLLVASAAMVGTLPGRTQGLGLVTEPLLKDLGLDRIAWARMNFWATMIGSGFALGVGRLVDRFGSRAVLTAIAVGLGVIVCAMSTVSSFFWMGVVVTLTRGLGQSALSVVSLALVGHWFIRRLSLAMAVYAIIMSIGFMIAFPLVGASVQLHGWRMTWFSIGLVLLVGLAPLAWLIVRRNPEACGLEPDGDKDAEGRRGDRFTGCDWRDAMSKPPFWVFAIGSALYGLIASGIGLFNESILAERGFPASVYYQTLVVTALSALVGNFLGGFLAERWTMPRLMFVAMLLLCCGLAALPVVSTLTHVMLWATAMGLGGGFVMVLFFGFWPRAYGRRHLGRIQGAAQALTVVASAVGPLLLAEWVAWTGSYGSMFTLLAVVVGFSAVAALAVQMPIPPDAASAARLNVT